MGIAWVPIYTIVGYKRVKKKVETFCCGLRTSCRPKCFRHPTVKLVSVPATQYMNPSNNYTLGFIKMPDKGETTISFNLGSSYLNQEPKYFKTFLNNI